MGGPRPGPQTAKGTQRQLHCDLGAVSTCANDVLHIVPGRRRNALTTPVPRIFARLIAHDREPQPPLELAAEVAIRQALKLRPSSLLAQAISLRGRARMGV